MIKQFKHRVNNQMFLMICLTWIPMICFTACLDEEAEQKLKVISKNQGVDGSLYQPNSNDQEESQGYGYGSQNGYGSQSSGLTLSPHTIETNDDQWTEREYVDLSVDQAD